MPQTLTSRAMALHAPRMLAASGIRLRYKRGRVSAVVDGLPGLMLSTDQNTEGETQITSTGESLLIRPVDLVLGGDRIEPQGGDQIERAEEGISEVWDVRPGSQGSAWDYSDGWRTFFRIFVIRREVGANVTSF